MYSYKGQKNGRIKLNLGKYVRFFLESEKAGYGGFTITKKIVMWMVTGNSGVDEVEFRAVDKDVLHRWREGTGSAVGWERFNEKVGMSK